MFEAEADGLNELRAAGEVRVPEVIDCGIMNGQSYIDLERLELEPTTQDSEHRFGEQLARLHRHTQDQFGWFRDNTIGLTPQRNNLTDNWVDFFRERRLGFQTELAVANGHGAELSDLAAKLAERLPDLFADYEPQASLLHGDLWGGNWGSVDGQPVTFDPAVYFGDRESDIAMTGVREQLADGSRTRTTHEALSALPRVESSEPVRPLLPWPGRAASQGVGVGAVLVTATVALASSAPTRGTHLGRRRELT